jgi:hypothetical protein
MVPSSAPAAAELTFARVGDFGPVAASAGDLSRAVVLSASVSTPSLILGQARVELALVVRVILLDRLLQRRQVRTALP